MPATSAGAVTVAEASCLFCGDSLADEGPGFWDHMARKRACHDAYDHWVEEILTDHPGG